MHLDLGHVGIYRGLVAQANLTQEQELALFEVLQRKSNCELVELLDNFAIAAELQTIFWLYPGSMGINLCWQMQERFCRCRPKC